MCVSLRMLLEKSSSEQLVFSVSVSAQAVTLRHGQPGTRAPLSVSFRTEGKLALERWTHVVLQVRSYTSRYGLSL